jgi:hypothetical protein
MDSGPQGMHAQFVADITTLPTAGTVFFDVRDEGRSLRLSWHRDSDTFVFSLWRGDRCSGSFQLAVADAPQLIHAMVSALTNDQPAALAQISVS